MSTLSKYSGHIIVQFALHLLTHLYLILKAEIMLFYLATVSAAIAQEVHRKLHCLCSGVCNRYKKPVCKFSEPSYKAAFLGTVTFHVDD